MTRWCSACIWLLLLSLAPLFSFAASPKRVLILDPLGRDVAPFSTAVSSFRTTLARELGEPVDIYELPLDLARFAESEGEGPVVAFLEGRIKSQPVDLAVPIGAAGAQFAARHRKRLFPDTPVLVVASAPPLVLPGAYPWRDEFGAGQIKHANLSAEREDTRNSSLYFGTKMARLLCGAQVRDSGYHLTAGGEPDERDPRYMDEVRYASVVTWQCIAPESIEKKARHLKNRLVEAEKQVRSAGIGIIHLAMDADVSCESSDLPRERNKQAILEFKSEPLVVALYVHYLVRRISESHSWLVDETVDKFGAGRGDVPSMMIFKGSKPLDNDLPAWKQTVPVPKS